MNILRAMSDPALFGRCGFDDGSWSAWRVFLAALFGLPPPSNGVYSHDCEQLYQNATGRQIWPREPAREAYVIAGRQSGKSRISALISVFTACFFDRRDCLAAAEVATIMLLAQDRAQARVLMRYCKGLLNEIPLLEQMVVSIKAESIELSNRTVIEIHTSNFASVRGYRCAACIVDELAFFSSEDSANPDVEILAALRPTLLSLPRTLLLCVSSPYRRSGVLWDAYRRWCGQYGPVLVWNCDSRSMNPTLPAELIEQALEEDPQRASSEYLAQFRDDIASFVDRETMEACVVPGRHELPRLPQTNYACFIDAAGGSGTDSFTLCIAHRDDATVVIDCIREQRPPFSPDSVCEEFAAVMRAYDCLSCTADKFAGAWVQERFAQHNVHVSQSARPKSELYCEMLPLLNSSRIQLLENSRLINQLCSLERRTSRAGKDSIDHPPYGGRDDVINSVAGAAHLCRARTPINPDDIEWGTLREVEPTAVLTGLSEGEREFPLLQDF